MGANISFRKFFLVTKAILSFDTYSKVHFTEK